MKFNKPAGDFKGPNKFLKVDDGSSVNGVFRGEIYTFYNKWVNGKGMACGHDDPGAKPRYKLNFITMEQGKLVAKIFEFPQTVFNQLMDVNDVYPLETIKVKLSRRGTGTDTTYTILPLLNEPISPAMMKTIEEIELNILDGKALHGASGSISGSVSGQTGPDELPF